MFRYFARLYEKYDYPIYPIVVFSYEQPVTPALSEFKAEFPDFEVLKFNYRVIQLNQLNWRNFLTQRNPVAAALMAKMKIAPVDRAKVKAECLRLLVTLNLDPARIQLISGFVDTYLRLNPEETLEFDATLEQADPKVRGNVMEIVTSWQLEGRAEGRAEGREEGRQSQIELVTFLLTSRLGQLPSLLSHQIQGLELLQLKQLGKQSLSFGTLDELAG